MLTLTFPDETRLHRLRAGGKLAALCLFTAVLFLIPSPAIMAAALLLVAGLHLAGSPRLLRTGVRALAVLWPFVAVVLVWHLWTGEARQGATIVLRMLAAVAAANLVTMTTCLSDMIAVIERLLRPLAPVLPPRRLALAIALVIRFVPVLAERAGQIADAFRARSPRRRAGWRVLAPTALAALDEADHVAEALRARGGAG